METVKGLILSGGRGNRLRPLTYTRAKQLIAIAGKPVLFYGVEDLATAGIREIGVVINPETGDEVRDALGDGSRWNVRFTYVVQQAPLGLADAVRCARSFLRDSPFVMYLGDNLLSGGITHLVAEYRNNRPAAIILITPVDDPRQFGVVVLDGNDRVTQLVEKPAVPPSNLALVGVYLFGPEVHDVIDSLRPSGRGEYEITEAIQRLVDLNRPVRIHRVRGWWKDTGRPEDLLEANRLVLSQVKREIRGDVQQSEILGEVVVETGGQIRNSAIRGPAYIGPDAIVEDSYVGPYTSLGRRALVQGSEIEYSILLDGAELHHLPYRLDASVLGNGATADGRRRSVPRQTLQLVLGDLSKVVL
ncbi:MAG TPA: glucose-1-phosphate thymidylyltransferase [bacterium]|nr:glucose-1-phosphate thymidylyltransferase [bacterium]